jgi:small subunit ribosomal protein S2
VVAVVDSNADPQGIAFPIPGNDDAIRAINLYCDMVAGAVFDGISAELQASGVDIGAAEELPVEEEALQPAEGEALPESPADVSSTGGVGIFQESVPPALGGASVAAGPVLPTAQASPTVGVDRESMETMVQNNRDDGNRAG